MVRSAFARFVGISCCLVVFFLSFSTAQAQSTGKILAHTPLNGGETLVSIDPGTQIVTPLGSGVPNSGSICLPMVPLSALDVAGHRYFFPEASCTSPLASAILHELDATTGAQITTVALSIQPVLAGLKFDSSSGMLFGHGSVGGAGVLLRIDPTSGTVTTVGAAPASLMAQAAIAALDPASHKYFFVDFTLTLHVLNTQTGAEIAAFSLSTTLFPAMPAAMEFDPSSGLLFCHGYLGAFPSGAEVLVTVDPLTGGVVSVGAWPLSGSLFDQLGMGALDSASHKYFFLDASSFLQQMNTQTGVASLGKPLSVAIFPSGMEFAPNLSSPPPPPPPPPADPYVAQVQPPINADGSSTFSMSRGSVPVKFTLMQNGAPTCTLPPATISLMRTVGGTTGTVDPGNGTSFRISDCQYVYNLGVGSLGPGTYEVDITITGSVVGKATFTVDPRAKGSFEKEDGRGRER